MSISNERVREILSTTDIDGLNLRLTGQLDRKEYEAVNKVLDALGGKWTRKVRAHVFETDPSELLDDYLNGGAAPKPARTVEGYVRTPDALARQIVEGYIPRRLGRGLRVLEPSAGDGSIVKAVRCAYPDASISAVEPNAARAARIPVDSKTVVHRTPIEDFTFTAPYDVVVMNPPFSVSGNRTIWIDHLRLVWRALRPDGRLVSIVPTGFLFRADQRHTQMRQLVAAHGGHADLDRDVFAESSAAICTCVVWMDKP